MTVVKQEKSQAESKNWVKTLLFGSNAAIFLFNTARNGLNFDNSLRRSLPTQGLQAVSGQEPCMAMIDFSIMKLNLP